MISQGPRSASQTRFFYFQRPGLLCESEAGQQSGRGTFLCSFRWLVSLTRSSPDGTGLSSCFPKGPWEIPLRLNQQVGALRAEGSTQHELVTREVFPGLDGLI